MPDTQPWTVLRLLNWTKQYLSRAGVESPRLTAEVLLAHSLDCSRIELYTRHGRVPSEPKLATFRQSVKRAAEHEPAAYIVGFKEFYSLRFRVTPDVLVPRPETELLVAEAVDWLSASEGGTVWDVCTGCGCVAAAIAANGLVGSVLATDSSEAAVAIARENIQALGLADQVVCAHADLLAMPGELDPAVADSFDRVGLIAANPPYVADGDPVAPSVAYEPRDALYAGADGLDVIRRLIDQAPGRLRPGGALALEFGFRHADAVRDLLTAGGFAEPKIIRDGQAIERAALATLA